MGGVRLYAIGIDEARDFVGATPAVAAQARADAAELFREGPPAVGKSGLLARVLRRRSNQRPTEPGRPTPEDLETVLSGHYPTPDRATACWLVLEHLIAGRAWGSHLMDLDERGIADFDFALVRAGGSADAGLAHVISSDARIGLCPVPGWHVGYVPHSLARHSADVLAGLDLTDAEHAPALVHLREFLKRFAGWGAAAGETHRPPPDLLAFHTVAEPVG